MRPKAETATDKKRGQKILNRLRVIRMLWPGHRTGSHATHRPARLSGSCAPISRRSSGG